MINQTYASNILTPYFMAEHREAEERYLKEKALLEVLKELENGKKYVIEITTDTIDRHNLDTIETRVKVHIQEIKTVPVMIDIDWSGCKPQPERRHRGWRRRTWKRR